MDLKLQLFFFFGHCHSMWDLSSLTRTRTWAPTVEAQSPNHWTAREVPKSQLVHL